MIFRPHIIVIILFSFWRVTEAELSYPYTASAERTKLIKGQFKKIKKGASKVTVLKYLKVPDEILDLYEPKMYKPKVIGETYWYIIQRMFKSGSVNEKNEKLVRVSFNLKGQVIEVTHWGF